MRSTINAVAILIWIGIPVIVASQPLPDITPMGAIAWIVCLSVLILADLLAGPLEDGLWAGYLNLAAMVAWLIWGLGSALFLVALGVTIVLLLRIYNYHLTGIVPLDRETSFLLWGERIVIISAALFTTAGIYKGFGGVIPLSHNNILILPVLFALLIGWGVIQVLSHLLSQIRVPFIWEKGQRHRIINELLLALIIVPLALIYETSGEIVFYVLLGLVAAQSMRHRQITQTEQTLMRRVQELSILNQMGQQISSTLVIEDVLKSIHDWITQFADVSLFYVALLDEDHALLRFPLVIQAGEKILWQDCKVADKPNIRQVIERRKTMRIKPNSWLEGYLGIPLIVSNKLFGVMGIEEHSRLLESLDIKTLETVANQASLALRNAILYDRANQLAQKLTYINQSVQDVMFNLDTLHATEAACRTAVHVASGNSAALILNQHNRLQMVDSVSLPEDVKTLYTDKLILNDISQIDSVTVYEFHQLEADSAWSKLMTAGNYETVVAIPLKSGNLPIGVLNVFHEHLHSYHSTEVELLETVGYQVAAALDNAELLGALEVYAAEQAQLVHLSRISTSSLETETVIRDVSDLLRQMIRLDWVRIGLMVDGANYLQIIQSDSNQKLAMLWDELPEVAEAQNYTEPKPSVYYRDAPSVSSQLKTWMGQNHIETLIISTIHAMNDLKGVILFGDSEKSELSDSDIRLLEMATHQISAQLYNAHLYEKTQNALNHRMDQLTIIENIAQQITSALDFDILIQHVLNAAISSTNASIALIGLYDESESFRVIWMRSNMMDELILPQPGGFMAEILRTGQPIIIEDTQEITNYEPLISEYRSIMMAPLKTDQEVVGVLAVQSDKPNFFTQDQIAFINNLAGHAVISIQNAQLLQDRQMQIETLTILRDLSVRLSSNTHISSVIQGILRTGTDLVDAHAALLYQYDTKWQLIDCIPGQHGGVYPIPEAILTHVYQTGQTYAVFDVNQHEAFLQYVTPEEVPYNSLIAVLIAHADIVEYVLVVTLNERCTDAERNQLELLAIQAAGHLENAVLYEQIRNKNDQMQAILDSTRDGVILLDRNGHLIEANISAARLLGVTLEDYIGLSFADSLVEHLAGNEDTLDDLRETLRVLRLDPEKITNRSFALNVDNTERFIQEVGSPVVDSDGEITGRLLTLRDITEEKSLESYRDELSSMVVHDLRGPLGSIISSLSLGVEIAQEAGDETIPTLMNVSLENAQRLLNLVDSLLDVYRLETRRIPLTPQPTQFNQLIIEAYHSLQSSMTEANIQLEIDVPETLPDVMIDGEKIRRVLVNLLDNALRFTPESSTVGVYVEQQGQMIYVRVADSGPGIPPQEASRIFEKFRQIKGSKPSRGSKGSGLGLTFCKLAVEAHQGKIWVDTISPLPGACFVFTLPVA